VDPTLCSQKTEVTPPDCTFALNDIEEPNTQKLVHDKAPPNLAAASTLEVLPRRAKKRIERDEPLVKYPNALACFPHFM
jgi:hypothetical protein